MAASVGEGLRQQRIADPYMRLRCMAQAASLTPRQLTDIEQSRATPTTDEVAIIAAAAKRGCGCRFCGTVR